MFCMLKLKKTQEHSEALRAEFKSEVELLAKIDHRNLVKLLGYVDQGNDCLIITEFVPNGTLREHLDGTVANFNGSTDSPFSVVTSFIHHNCYCLAGLRGDPLDFNQRLEISIDVAHALTYLHTYSGYKNLYLLSSIFVTII